MNFCKILKFSRNTCFCYEIARFPLRNIFQYKTRNLLCKSRRILEYAAETSGGNGINQNCLMKIGAEKIIRQIKAVRKIKQKNIRFAVKLDFSQILIDF